MTDNPTGVAAVISTAVKAVLLALIATGALPWTDAQVTAVTLAVATVVDLALFLGLVRPRVTPVSNPRAADGTALVPANIGLLGDRYRH